ncbi:MAG: Na+/H+ antiporter subunit E [Pseudomonadota bacterium]|nr:MAG: Na+/H+ antiporter subunit E [Pseudomonadota bacterium]
MRYVISLALVMAALWLGLSGLFKPVILALGAVSIALAAWLSWRMDVIGVEHNPGLFSWRLPVYWAWLVWQIVLSNIDVARAVFNPGGHIRQRVIRVPARQSRELTRVTYANSITLTPGTVSLRLEGNEIVVHALTQASANGVLSGEMGDRVCWLEGQSR